MQFYVWLSYSLSLGNTQNCLTWQVVLKLFIVKQWDSNITKHLYFNRPPSHMVRRTIEDWPHRITIALEIIKKLNFPSLKEKEMFCLTCHRSWMALPPNIALPIQDVLKVQKLFHLYDIYIWSIAGDTRTWTDFFSPHGRYGIY